jgi:hypothetical protein
MKAKLTTRVAPSMNQAPIFRPCESAESPSDGKVVILGLAFRDSLPWLMIFRAGQMVASSAFNSPYLEASTRKLKVGKSKAW